MNSKIRLFASLLSLLIIASSSDAFGLDLFAPETKGCNDNYDLDYMLLALQWSAGVCSTSSRECERGQNVNNFTVHGFWANRFVNRLGPQNCCFERKFKFDALAPIMDKLKVYWYGYFGKDEIAADKQFWEHEWTKHGTCAKNIEALHGELNYFNHTLHTFLDLPIIETLAKSGIVPDNTKPYKTSDIIETLKSIHNGKNVEIGCNFEHNHNPVPDLIGVNFCYSPELVPIDCPPPKGRCKNKIIFKKTVEEVSG